MSVALRVLIIFLLVFANAIFVAAEYALVTARRSRLEERAEQGHRRARTALQLMDRPVRFISTVQVGITVSAILLGAIGEPLVSSFIEDAIASTTVSFLLAFAILTYLSVVLGELVPKAVALQRAELLAIMLAVPLDWLARIAYPLVVLLDKSANLVLRVLRVKPAPAGMIAYTRDDIRHSVAAAEDVGELQQAEEEMLYKVFDFASKEVAAVMVPRPDVVAISADMPPEEALATVVDSPYTRYPVYRNSLDEIIGILHVRDLFAAMHDLGIASVRLETIARPAYVVPETKDLAALLADFRREKQHLAIVVDEYGSVDGIVTLEDVLEEIVGEIEDEFDLPDTSVERIDDNRVRIDGSYTIDDFNETFGTGLEQDGYHTMAGLVFGSLGRAPEVGDSRPGGRRAAHRARGGGHADRQARGRARRGGEEEADRRAGSRLDTAMARTRSPFGHRDFALYFAAQTTEALALTMATVAIGWQVYSVRENPLDLALVALAEFIPLPLLALPAGHLADRFPRWRLWTSMLALNTLVLGGLLAVTLSGADKVWPFFALAFLQGLGSAIGAPASRAMMPSLVPQDLLLKALAQRSVGFQLTVVAGPAAGGLLFAIQDELVYAVGIVLSLAAVGCALFVQKGREPANTDESAEFGDVLAGVRLIRRTRVLFGAISLDLFAVLLGGAVALLPIFAKDVLEVGPTGLGLLRASTPAGAFLTALVLARFPIRRHAGPTLFFVVAGFGASIVLFGLSRADVALDARAGSERRVRPRQHGAALDDRPARDP